MATVFHFISRWADPKVGGLEQSTIRVAGHLARLPETEVRIYSLNDIPGSIASTGSPGVKIVYLKPRRDFLAEPLRQADAAVRRDAEMHQIEFLLYRSAVQAAIAAEPTARHALISFFLSRIGFVAQHVADALAIPHLASVRGSDFNRDFRHPQSFAAIGYTIRCATWIVTTNDEQAATLKRVFGRDSGVTTIRNSVTFPVDGPHWQPTRCAHVQLTSDGGYSFKKGTHVLLRVVAELAREGVPLRLTVVGNVESRATAYWQAQRAAYAGELPDVFAFRDWIPATETLRLLEQADIYCAPTLGEGCSSARLHALAYGIPIATTRTGEIADVAGDAVHVGLAAPGDVDGFKALLREMAKRTLDGGIAVDRERVRAWRLQFEREGEFESWRKVAIDLFRHTPQTAAG